MQEERDVDIKDLWKEAFGDDDEFISSFTEGLKGRYRRYTVIEKNRLLSILHVLSFEMDGFRIGYIYGVATLSEARKRGYASQLIKKAIDDCAKMGFDAVVTIPANEELRKFYNRFGFEGCWQAIFISSQDFDFGTGETEKDLLCALPLNSNMVLPPPHSSLTLHLSDYYEKYK